jgi:hypothetical protein
MGWIVNGNLYLMTGWVGGLVQEERRRVCFHVIWLLMASDGKY